jgi:hypothetical protein
VAVGGRRGAVEELGRGAGLDAGGGGATWEQGPRWPAGEVAGLAGGGPADRRGRRRICEGGQGRRRICEEVGRASVRADGGVEEIRIR